MNEGAEEKISRMQAIEQNIQNLMMQKQQLQAQLVEATSALEELGKTDTAYKIIGNIMVLSEKQPLKAEIETKKEMTELRIKAIEKQSDDLRAKAKKMQDEVMAEMDRKGQ